ncbi:MULTISPECIES: MtrAB system histidine kinase MtrB [unclassified Streptomyces]|uniref:MtrAB system histidine kinase MtrB n=1 Tax=unclassified Streptomyces TaxID=2593676 RepID=UPI0001C1BB49|nr:MULTISPECIES: MtrAB system histidine kinase MtrB [unclassified Streptomyces]AEN10367.1 integral membrane sensor signal transduction histidine kinase [Streptomyces sp. SirexAA-E]MYR65045.1 HAMP domain-containing protein [Streptomyces sp. SID4939]MYS02348.1 HAMP domain-containing protein [Streptomyces sp. SID4940]MYT65518.1 HAMP domain-containing protein [Streptomyces sp. SID8357]MYT84573.1 HAMP domain-containing protein [Streptomyces sp. SID8360]
MTLGSSAPKPGGPGVRTERAAGSARRFWRFGRVLRDGRLFPDRTPGGPVLRLLMRWIRRPLLPAVRLWRRNLQLRVVAGTLLMSIAVVLLLGFVVIGQVKNGLLDAKAKAAQTQAAGGFAAAQANANAPLAPGDQGEEEGADGMTANTSWRTELVDQLASGGTNAFNVVALSADSVEQGATSRAPRGSGSVEASSVPQSLREAVGKGPGAFQTYSSIKYSYGKDPQPGLVVGKRLYDIDHNPYELYYLFPLTQEEKSLTLVTTTLATAGLFVVVLLGAIAWFVVRQVVTPVRMAAGIAERLSAGRLQERMKVTGEDDIARLGEAFNKMAQNLQLKIQQLEELSRMQRRFVSDVSHELRTPLTTVRMAADVIHEARVDFDPVTARSAELLGDQLDRFESLLSDLLEISRFDAGAAALDAEPIDLRTVVRRVIGGAEPLAERKGSRIVVVGDEQPVVAEADPRRVERVLRNLVVNAVEHGEGRDVVVRMGVAQGAVAVAVRDYGVGLKPGEATRVFNRFWRADPARARTTGGTGLGLSIAVEDARLHGGWLQAWGEPGGGSQFRLTLPRTADEPLRGSPIPLEPEDSRRNREDRERTEAASLTTAEHRLLSVPSQGGCTTRGQLPVPSRGSMTPRPAPASVDPAALPGNGARVVPRPAGERPGGRTDPETQDPEQEDTTRGH